MGEEMMAETRAAGAPDFRAVSPAILGQALRLGWQDLRRAPVFGLVFAALYIAIGWAMA